MPKGASLIREKGITVSMRKTFAIVVIGASLFMAGVPAQAEDNIEPDSATAQGINDGENGYQTISFNVTIPSQRSGHDDITMKVAGDCEFTTVGRPNTNKTELFVVAHSSSTVHSVEGVPVSTGVRCRVFNGTGGIDVAQALPFNNSVSASTAEITYGAFTLCIQISVHYSSDDFDRTREVCRTPQ